MSTEINILNIPRGKKQKFSADEITAFEVIEETFRKSSEAVKERQHEQRVSSEKLQRKAQKLKRIFKAYDVAIWSVLAVEIGVLALIWLH